MKPSKKKCAHEKRKVVIQETSKMVWIICQVCGLTLSQGKLLEGNA